MALSKIRAIDSESKEIVFDYINQHERKNKPLSLPMMLKYLCLQFYAIQEYFKNYPKSQMIIKNDTENEIYNVEGNENVINVNDTSIIRYKWRFKILSFSTYFANASECCIGIGLISPEKDDLSGEPFSFRCWSVMPKISYRAGKYIFPNKEAKIGDIMEMVLNLENNKLGFRINDKGDFQYRSSFEGLWKVDINWIRKMEFRLDVELIGEASSTYIVCC